MTPTNQQPDAERPRYCAECGAQLSAGGRFCHRCGTPVAHTTIVSERPTSRAATLLPWIGAVTALVIVVALLASRTEPSRPSAQALGVPREPVGGGPPDIGAMTPSERANRLYVRVMQYAEVGQADSVARFAPMVLAAHAMLQDPTDDERYHFGRAAEVVGSIDVAKSQADTILQHNPSSLLGLLLAARVAQFEQRAPAAKEFDKRLLAVLERELATGNADYENHRAEIDLAVTDARRRP